MKFAQKVVLEASYTLFNSQAWYKPFPVLGRLFLSCIRQIWARLIDLERATSVLLDTSLTFECNF